jgi:Na+/melibiose symporter-like transporter
VVFIFLPVVFYVAAFLVMWNYPISETRHQRLLGLLERRRQRRAAARQGAAA